MNTFALEIFDDTGSQCTFYTVRWDYPYSETTETDKFFEKFENDPKLERPLMELAQFLTIVIANEYGASNDFFKFEKEAQGLPPSGRYKVEEVTINYANFPLRLYCLKITNHLVVLFNGNEKTSQSAQEGKTRMAFHNANIFAERINKAMADKTLTISEDQRNFNEINNPEPIIL